MGMEKNLRAVGYVRVSSSEQRDNFSISAQIREIGSYCQNKGWTLLKTYVEEGKSAWTDRIDKRPHFKKLLADMKRDLFDLIIVHSLDRWSRNLVITLQTFKEMNECRVAFASVSENIDYSTPEGRLFIAMLGVFAQYFSDSLAKHVKKGVKERAIQGYHLGSIPFGYAKCECCDAGVHDDSREAAAVTRLFEMYASGNYTLAQLAKWINGQGLRTRNTKTLKDAYGNEVLGPQRFTLYSVRWILHNPFYAGFVPHGKDLYIGKHKPLISTDLFDAVQKQLRKSRTRMHTTGPTYRTYLLKGLLRCVWCGLPIWAETLWHGGVYYRERKMARGQADCANEGKMIRAEVLDEQVERIATSIKLEPRWKERILEIMATLDQHNQIEAQRRNVEQKLRRLGKAYVDGLIDESEYEFQQRVLKSHLESLVLPGEQSTLQAGHMLENLPLLWERATPEERHTILKGLLECVYVDIGGTGSVVGIKPKPQFLSLFRMVGTDPSSGVALDSESSEPDAASELDLTGWWRRGRVELPVQRKSAHSVLQA